MEDGKSAHTTTVSAGEVCTIEFSKNKNIFGTSKFFKDTFEEGSNIKTYNGQIGDETKPYSICTLSDDKSIAYENCAYKYNNPYLVNTVIDNKSYCMLPKDIYPTPEVTKNNDIVLIGNTSNTSITSHIYNKYPIKNLCEERWHDWFCIPDYHLGNKYYNEVPDKLSDTKSVGTCFVPCPFNYIPRDDINNAGKCILKNEFNGGLFAGTFNYTPLAIICLFGLNEKLFSNKDIGYPSYIEKKRSEIASNPSLEFNNNIKNEDIINYIKDDKNNVIKTIWADVKNDIAFNCNKIHEVIPGIDDVFIENNIIEPDNMLRDASAKDLNDNILFAYNIAKEIKKYIDNNNEDPRDANYEDYKKWKRGLISTNDSLTKEKLKLHVKMIKKCANICFDGKSKYSKDYILYTLKKDPIEFEDIDFDPEDEEIIINNFNIKKKKENFFESYTNIFNTISVTIDYYIISILLIIFIIVLYVIYITYYSTIIQIINYIYNTILWRYYDIRSIILYKIIFRDNVDDNDLIKKSYIRNSYMNIRDLLKDPKQ